MMDALERMDEYGLQDWLAVAIREGIRDALHLLVGIEDYGEEGQADFANGLYRHVVHARTEVVIEGKWVGFSCGECGCHFRTDWTGAHVTTTGDYRGRNCWCNCPWCGTFTEATPPNVQQDN